MMTLPDGFNASLAQFGETIGTDLKMVDGRCSFVVDDRFEVELDYVDEAHVVVAWATVGIAPDDEWKDERANALLAFNEIDADNGGFSISMDPETRRVIAHDNRPAELFDTADRLAVWIETLVVLVGRIRYDFAERFPCNDFEHTADNGADEKEEV